MLDQNALRSFVIAADTLNFSRTAELRNTVQSAISTHIRKLEAELGSPLFERGRGQAMHLTQEGQAFAVYARRILALSDEAVETLRSAKNRRVIRLGTTVTLSLSVVAAALRDFTALDPDVQVHIQCDRSDALLARLDADEIDLAFMMDQGKRNGREYVQTIPLVWVGGPSVVPDPEADVPLAFLTDGRDLRRFAYEALDRVGRRGYLAHLSPHPIGVRSFVLADLAVTVMPQVAVVPPLQDPGSRGGLPPLKPVALSVYRQQGCTRDDIAAFAHCLMGRTRTAGA